MFNGARIGIAPLDWGLGHATRDVPLIRRLLEMDARPVILADKAPLALLHSEFPELPFAVLPGVDVRYAKGRSQAWAMARQFPAMARSIRGEREQFAQLQRTLALDAVISDNRFGVRMAGLPSAVITHQVYPFTPMAQMALRRLNLRLLNSFDRVWVPDEATAPGLAGELAHGRRNSQLPLHFLGPISRMDPATAKPPASPYRIVAVVSGPEPQRTLLERTLLQQLPGIPGEHLLVRGKPAELVTDRSRNVTILPHLSGAELAGAMRSAELIISRTGYTTLMDLVALQRSALLIPTPGQAEQEYLGKLHARTGRFLIQQQDALDIAAALAAPPTQPPATRTDHSRMDRALEDFATLIQRSRVS